MADYLVDNYSQEVGNNDEQSLTSQCNINSKSTKSRKCRQRKRDLKKKSKESDSDSSFNLEHNDPVSEVTSKCSENLTQPESSKITIVPPTTPTKIAKFDILASLIRHDKTLNICYNQICSSCSSIFADFFPRLEHLLLLYPNLYSSNPSSTPASTSNPRSILRSITKHPRSKENTDPLSPSFIDLTLSPPPILSILNPCSSSHPSPSPSLPSLTSHLPPIKPKPLSSSLQIKSFDPTYNPAVTIIIDKAVLSSKPPKKTKKPKKTQETEEIIEVKDKQVTVKTVYKPSKNFDVDAVVGEVEEEIEEKKVKKKREVKKKQGKKRKKETIEEVKEEKKQKRLETCFDEIKESMKPLVKTEEGTETMKDEIVEVKVKPEDDLMLNNEFGIIVLNYRAKKLVPEQTKILGYGDSYINCSREDIEEEFGEGREVAEVKGEIKDESSDGELELDICEGVGLVEGNGLETVGFEQNDVFLKKKDDENEDKCEAECANLMIEYPMNENCENILKETEENKNEQEKLNPKSFFKQRECKDSLDQDDLSLSCDNSLIQQNIEKNNLEIPHQPTIEIENNKSIPENDKNTNVIDNSQHSQSLVPNPQDLIPRYELLPIDILKREMGIFGIKAVPSKSKMVKYLKQIWSYFHLDKLPDFMIKN